MVRQAPVICVMAPHSSGCVVVNGSNAMAAFLWHCEYAYTVWYFVEAWPHCLSLVKQKPLSGLISIHLITEALVLHS